MSKVSSTSKSTSMRSRESRPSSARGASRRIFSRGTWNFSVRIVSSVSAVVGMGGLQRAMGIRRHVPAEEELRYSGGDLVLPAVEREDVIAVLDEERLDVGGGHAGG